MAKQGRAWSVWNGALPVQRLAFGVHCSRQGFPEAPRLEEGPLVGLGVSLPKVSTTLLHGGRSTFRWPARQTGMMSCGRQRQGARREQVAGVALRHLLDPTAFWSSLRSVGQIAMIRRSGCLGRQCLHEDDRAASIPRDHDDVPGRDKIAGAIKKPVVGDCRDFGPCAVVPESKAIGVRKYR